MKREILAVFVFVFWSGISGFLTFKTGHAGFWLITDFVVAFALFHVFKYK